MCFNSDFQIDFKFMELFFTIDSYSEKQLNAMEDMGAQSPAAQPPLA